MRRIESSRIKQMVRNILTVRPDEIGCAECLERMDRFVDMQLDGKDPGEAMPLVRDHLRRCRDCHEEFRALLSAVQAAGEHP